MTQTGSYSDGGTSTCTSCAIGKSSGAMNTASGHSGSGSCTYCSPGQIGVINGSSALCVNCAAGYYSSTSGFKQTVGFDALTPNTTCDNCPAGQGSQLGASTCTACVAGKYSIGNGPCQACPKGSFSSGAAQSCTSCDAGIQPCLNPIPLPSHCFLSLTYSI